MSCPQTKVGELVEQVRGVTYSSGDAIDESKDGYVELLRANNIDEGYLRFDGVTYVPKSKVSEKQYLKEGDILIAASSGSISIVGKAASFNAKRIATFGAFCKVLRPKKNVDARYIANFFQTSKYRHTVSSLAEGANINNLRNEHIDNLDILLPPLTEQKRIADILDKAAAIKAKREQAIAKLDELAQSTFVEMFGDTESNPKKISKKSLGDLIKVKSGNFLPAVEMGVNGHFPVYGGNGINGYHNEYMFSEKQIVIGRVGAYCGCVHVTEANSWITDNALYVDEFDSKLDFEYLAFALEAAKLNKVSSQSGQPLVSGARIYRVEILMPEIEHQKHFANFLKTLKAQKNKLNSIYQVEANLRASLQHQAFTTGFNA